MDPSVIASVVAEVLSRISSRPSTTLLPSSDSSDSTSSSSTSSVAPSSVTLSSEGTPSPRVQLGRGQHEDLSSASSSLLSSGTSSGMSGGSLSSSHDSTGAGEDDCFVVPGSVNLLESPYMDFSLQELIKSVVQEGMDSDGVLDIACSSSTKKAIESDLPKLLKVRLVEPSIWAELCKSPKDKAAVLERINTLKIIIPFANAIFGMVNSLGDPKALHDSARLALAYAAVTVSLSNRDLANVTCDSFGVPRDNVSEVPFFSKNSILKAIKKRQSADIIANALKVSRPKFKGNSKFHRNSKGAEPPSSSYSSSSSSSSSSSRGGTLA